MKKFLIFYLLVLVSLGHAYAQDAGATYKKANQQYVLFESERDKGTNAAGMYTYLLEAYNDFVQVTKEQNKANYIQGTKNRLRSIYPYLLNAALYYYEQKENTKALDFAAAYIDTRYMPLFRSELLPKDDRYNSIVYFAAVTAYNMKKLDQAKRYFQIYLESGDSTQEKDCFVYLNMIYMAQKNYEEQENILEKAISKYPVSLDFLYNLVNVHIATNNMPKLLNAIDRILKIDPNNLQVLPIKARILERQGNNLEALDIYKRLYALAPNNFELLTGLARANFNVATKIVNDGATIASDTEYALVRQKAATYLEEAQKLFMEILKQKPDSKMYMQGLAEVYQYMDMTSEYEVLNKIIADGASFTTFAPRLLAYNEALKKSQEVTNNASSEPTPVVLEPAQLVIRVDSFIDGNNNKVIDAGESFAVKFSIANKGKGDAYSVRIRLSEQQGYDQYFEGPRELDGGNIPAGTTKEYTFRYLVKKEVPTALAKINIYAFEANGFDADPSELIVNTQEYAMPRLKIADHQFFASNGSSITLGSNGKLTIALQNFGTKTARNVKVNFTLPKNVYTTDSPEMQIDSIAPGEVATLDYGFLVNKRFSEDSVAVMLTAADDTRSSIINEAYKVKLGEYLTASTSIKINGKLANRKVNMQDFQLSFKSELLDGIPEGAVNRHRYALIIGNEDYSMTGANAEINVPYAVNDAMVFREYCVRTFGIPASQIKMIPNATAGMMHEQLDWLLNMASTDPDAELFFYYSGHGNNDEATKQAYLLPVDITGKNIHLGISLADLYQKLATYPVKGAYVFLDACFSGGYKSAAPLIAQKGVRVVPKLGMPQGNTISFSSSSGDQTSSVYHDKKQGYYTYYLLKTIKDSHGDITMQELFDKTNAEVKKATALLGKMQEPQYIVSPTWKTWGSIQLKTPETQIHVEKSDSLTNHTAL